MTTLAIIGGGIAGRSLLYALAKKKKKFSKIVLFDSDTFAHTCSLRSTAIVAARGVSEGHSSLGDLLFHAFETFSRHVHEDRPQGVFPITQYSGAISKLDQFQKRYPEGLSQKVFPGFKLKNEMYVAHENAYMIDPAIYLDWLLGQTHNLPLEKHSTFVMEVHESGDGVELKTQGGASFTFDQVIFAGGSYNRYWGAEKSGKPVQGSYLEFSQIDLGEESFSLTLEGDNFVYHAHSHHVLIGSTTDDDIHELPPLMDLKEVYDRLASYLDFKLPAFEAGRIVVGMREKAAKRSPYVLKETKISRIGGFYKNGYSLGLHLGLELAEKF